MPVYTSQFQMAYFAALTKQEKAFRRTTFLPLAVCRRLCPKMLLAWHNSSCDVVNLHKIHISDNNVP